MYLLPGNPFSQAVEAYRDSGEALCSKGVQAVPRPFSIGGMFVFLVSEICNVVCQGPSWARSSRPGIVRDLQ